ncbi:MAG: hypothetical protein DRG24_09290, partial [Epsilonproteobacteria bacterium]
MRVWKVLVLPALAMLIMSGCGNDSDTHVIRKGNVNGIVVVPKLSDDDNNDDNSLLCVHVPIPGGYKPLADVNVTYLDENDLLVDNSLAHTDACGRFYHNIDTTKLKHVQISAPGYRTMISDVTGFETKAEGWGIISTVDVNNSFAVRINTEGASLMYNGGNNFKYSVIDVKTSRAVLGIPQILVSMYKEKNETDITYYNFNDLNADLVLTLDDSGSMNAEVIDTNGSVLGTRLDLTFLAAKSFIDELSGNSQLGINIFDGEINFINQTFMNSMGFTNNGVPVGIPYNEDGFVTNKKLSKFVVDVYHPNSEIYDLNSSAVSPLPSEFPYKATTEYKWGGMTALYDVAFKSAETLSARNSEYKISVLMTDGYDTASSLTNFATTIDLAKKNNIIFYTIAMGPDLDSTELNQLAVQTGGLFFAADGADIGDKFRDVLSDIQYFYEIGTDIEENTTVTYRVDVVLDGETVSGVIDYNSTLAPDPDPDPEEDSEGAQLYQKCAPCHGATAEKSAYGVTAIINRWSSSTIKDALEAYKAGTRDEYGYGELMHTQVSTYTDEQIEKVSKYIPTLNTEGCGLGVTTLSGSVFSAQTQAPLSGVQIYMEAISGEGNLSASTDENGSYVFENLVAGQYALNFPYEGYMEAEAEFKVINGCLNEFGQIVLIPSSEEGKTVSFNGKVIDAVTGEPIADSRIELHNGYYRPEGPLVTSFTTDENGDFNQSILTNYYTAKVIKSGYITSDTISFSAYGTTLRKDFTLAPTLGANEVRIVLTWGKDPYDLDSHLSRMDGDVQKYHIYYGHKTATASEVTGDESASLDVDDVTSYGPETVTLKNMVSTSTYKYYVHHFAGEGSITSTSQASVSLYIEDEIYTFRAPSSSSAAKVWKVFDIRNGTVIPCSGNCLFDDTSYTRAPALDRNQELPGDEVFLFTDRSK